MHRSVQQISHVLDLDPVMLQSMCEEIGYLDDPFTGDDIESPYNEKMTSTILVYFSLYGELYPHLRDEDGELIYASPEDINGDYDIYFTRHRVIDLTQED